MDRPFDSNLMEDAVPTLESIEPNQEKQIQRRDNCIAVPAKYLRSNDDEEYVPGSKNNYKQTSSKNEDCSMEEIAAQHQSKKTDSDYFEYDSFKIPLKNTCYLVQVIKNHFVRRGIGIKDLNLYEFVEGRGPYIGRDHRKE